MRNHERGTNYKFCVPMRNRTSDLWIPDNVTLILNTDEHAMRMVRFMFFLFWRAKAF